MATFYFDKFAGGYVDANWQTLGNWWLNRAATIPATSLPTSSDDVVMLTICSENTGSEPTVNTAILEDNFSINLTVTNGMIVKLFSQIIFCTITGNVIFEDDSSLAVSGIINGNASFTENSYHLDGTITGTTTYEGLTGIIEDSYSGNITFTNGRASKFYWNGAVDNNYHTLGNWWISSNTSTWPAAYLPLNTDDVVMLFGPNVCEIVEEDIVVNTINIQTSMYVAGPRANIWEWYSYPKSLTATTSIKVEDTLYGAAITTPILYLCPNNLSTVWGTIYGDVIADANFCGGGGAAYMNADVIEDLTVESASHVFVGAVYVAGNIEVKPYGELHGFIGCQNLIMRTDSTLCGTMSFGITNTMTFEGNSKIQEKNTYYGAVGPSYLFNATFNDTSSIQNPEYTPSPPLTDMVSYGITTFNEDSLLVGRTFINDGNILYFNNNATINGSCSCYSSSWSISAAAKLLTLGGGAIYSDIPAEIRYEKGVNGSSILGVV